MKIVLLNDTTIGQTHFGCYLVMQNLRRLFAEHGIRLLGTVSRAKTAVASKDTKGMLKAADLVVVNAEGSLHSDRYHHLVALAAKYPTAIINGSYDRLSPLYIEGMKKAKYVSARESGSIQILKRQGLNADLVPDVFFAYDIPKPVDPPTVGSGLFDSVDQAKVGNHKLISALVKPDVYFKEAAKYRQWVTGRFHGICLALLWGQSFAAYDSNTHKNTSLMIDCGLSRWYAPDLKEAISRLGQVETMPERIDKAEYVTRARVRIESMMKALLHLGSR